MEFVGLALGVYPVFILALEQFKTGSEYFSNWRRFRRQYEGFLSDVTGQQLLFEGILQDLLCGGPDPYLSGIDSKEEFLRIVSDESYPGWSDPKLTENLKVRLGKRYNWYMDTISRMYDIFKDFGEIIDIQTLESSDRTPDWWKYQWERVKKTLFDKERYEKREKAARLIDELRKMLELSDSELLSQGKRTALSIVPFLNRVRSNAYNLHEALKNVWHCHCNSAHKTMLQLEQREHDRESDFNVLFVLRKHGQRGSDTGKEKNTEPEVAVSCIERQAHIKIIKNIDKCNENGNDKDGKPVAQLLLTAPEIPSVLTPLSSNNPRALLSPSPRPALRNSQSSQSIQSTTSSESSRINLFHGLKKLKSKFRSSRDISAEIKQSAKAKQPQSPSPDTISLKGVGFTKPGSVNPTVLTKSGISLSVSPATSSSELGDPQVPNNSEGVSQPANITEARPAESQNLDLCATIRHSIVHTSLDHPMDIGGEYLRFRLGPKTVRKKEGSISLQELLEGDSHHFPPAKRALVATILASSLLQLHQTQWIREYWSKRDIFFRSIDGVVIFDQLYISTVFTSSTAASVAENAVNGGAPTAEADLTLSITSSTVRSTLTTATGYMTASRLSSPQPQHIKASLESLGILLIELCFGEPIERRQDKVTVRPQGPADNEHPNHDFCLAIANKWTWQEISAWEPSFANPIDMCLRFPSLGRAQAGEHDGIVQDMYAAIVKPLQDGMSKRW